MAIKEVSLVKGVYPNTACELEFVAASSAADGFAVDFSGGDGRTVLLLNNTTSAEATATVKAGNGLQGVADEVIIVPASGMVAVCLESGRFKNVSGDLKGKVQIVPSATTLELAVAALL